MSEMDNPKGGKYEIYEAAVEELDHKIVSHIAEALGKGAHIVSILLALQENMMRALVLAGLTDEQIVTYFKYRAQEAHIDIVRAEAAATRKWLSERRKKATDGE